MNATLFFDPDLPGILYRQIEAYDLCENNTLDRLDAIARQLGVASLYDFVGTPDYSDLPQDQQLALLLGHWSEAEWGERPEREPLWFDAARGLETVRALRGYLKEHPRAIRSGKRELREFERALQLANQQGARFRLHWDV